MDTKSSQPLMRGHLPILLLGAAITLYGVVTAVVGSWLSNKAMTGSLTAGAYRSQMAAFDQTAGLLAGILFLALFLYCAAKTKGIVRTAFGIAAVTSIAPILATRAENLLFNVMGLPTMGAGSVVAGAVTALLFALPLTISFILLASSRRVPKGCRWVALLSVFLVLAVALYPIYVTVLAFLIRPGDPAVGRMMEVSSTVIKLRYILLGVSYLLLAFISIQFSRTHPRLASPIDALPQAGGV